MTAFQNDLQRRIDRMEQRNPQAVQALASLRQELRTSIETKGQSAQAIFSARAMTSPKPPDAEIDADDETQ